MCHGIDKDDGNDEESLRAQMRAPNQASQEKDTQDRRVCLLCDCYSDPRG